VKKSFTLLEILIIVIILGILTTFAIPTYYNIVQKAKAKGCAVNLRVLMAAVDAYAAENSVLPATLGEIPQEHIERAWAKVLEEEGAWKIKLVHFIVDFDKRTFAYAQRPTLREFHRGSRKDFICPADDTVDRSDPNYTSYVLSDTITQGGLRGGPISFSQYKALDPETVIIRDRYPWHKRIGIRGRSEYRMHIAKNKEVIEE